MSEPGFPFLNPLQPPPAKVEIFDSESMLTWALRYARGGWYILPLHSVREGACTCGNIECGSPGKHPRYNNEDLANGVRDAIRDEKVILHWWHRWPEANIGIATGQPSGIFALDIDPRNGGEDSLSVLVRKYGQLPETLTALTGGGGSHKLFQHPGGKVKNRSSHRSFGSGLDIKADGGYIVAAPSIHFTGGRYRWAGDQ